MNKINSGIILTSYWFSHAVIDFVCAATILWLYYTWEIFNEDLFYIALLYNCSAFGLQILFWALADKFKFSKSLALLWCLFVWLGPIFYSLHIPLLSVIGLGIGNALFHIWWWITTLAINPWKSKYPGIFVAPWAIGLFLGTTVWMMGYYTGIESLILLVISALAMFFSSYHFSPYSYIKKFTEKNSNKDRKLPALLILSLLFISVIIRSFIWFLVNYSRKEWFLISLIFVCFVALWKALWGILWDKYWWKKVWVWSLLLSLPFLLLWEYWMWFGLLWIFLFNITMPIVFSGMIKLYPEKSWTMFWLLCMALLIWALPKLLGVDYMWNEIILLIYFILISAFVVYCSFKAMKITK